MNETLIERRPYSIPNLGNTCFINSCIQILCHCELFHDILSNNQNKNTVDCNCIEYVLWKNWIEISGKTYNTKEQQYLHPKGLLSAIEEISMEKKSIFSGENIEQHDFFEFTLFIIDNLHACIKKTRHIQINGTPQHDIDKLAITCYKYLYTIYEQEFSEIHELFHGIMVSTITPIHNETIIHSSTPEIFFSLDIPVLANHCSLHDCLRVYFQEETLEGENAWYNEKSCKKEDIQKKSSIFRFPKILWIVLKRFSYDGVSKNHSKVEFPTTLDMYDFACGYHRTKQKYDLYAICNHYGNLHYGHYNCVIKMKSGSWFSCDDDRIQKVSKENIFPSLYSHVYCLVYVKKDVK